MTVPDPKDGPTQAQIEAAARKIDDEAFEPCLDPSTPTEREIWNYNSDTRRHIAREKAKAALTAAAKAQIDFVCPKCGSRGCIKNGATTITTPSRVPETAVIRPDRDAVSLELLGRDREIARLQNEIDNIEAATIERCAQVAENIVLGSNFPMEAHSTCDLIAAAIRAMGESL